MSEFKKTEAFLERFKEYGKDIPHEEHQPDATNPPLWRFDTLLKCVKRDKLTQDLFKTIKSADYKYVNLWGIGGVGKSCLVSLCIDQNRDRFGSVLYFPIDHRSIEYDTVDLIKNKAFFSVLKERQNLGDDVERNFDILMTALNEYAQPGKINLLIFDINDKVFEDKDKIQENEDKDTNRKKVDKDKMQEYDDKGKKSFIAKLRRDPYLLPPKWKVLFVSHSMCFNKSINDGNNADSDTVRNCCDILLEDTDKDFARRLFDKLCNKQLNYDDKQREEIIKNLLYHPLLISVLPYVLHTNTNNKRIIKFVKEKSVSMRGHKKDENIAQYLNELVRLDRLSPNQRIIAIMFMLWPTDFIPYKVVCSLLHDYVFEHDKGKGKLHHESDIYKYNLIDFEKKYEVDEQVNASFDTALNQLVDFNILMRSGDSYQMHSMMADVLRGQYYKYIHHWWTKVLRFFGGVVDHTTYVKVSKEVLGNVSDDINRNTYLNCFVNSIPWLHKKDPVCGRMKELASIIQNSQILFFARALEYSQTIEEQKEPEKKIALLYEFGQFYENGIFKTGNETITGYRDTSSALIQYEKAIDIFKENHNLIKNHSTIVNLYLKCAELSQSVNYFETAFAYYQIHKLECKLNERYCKLMELLPDDFDVEVQNDNKRADAYYRLGKFYEDYYWSEHTYWFKKLSKSLLNQADRIWASLPAETEGPLKGFVKTSYGIYDPDFGFKLVKVEKGKFIMGTTPGEELRAKQKLYQISDDELPAHEVTIEDAFYIGMFPVTQGEWTKCISEINKKTQMHLPDYTTMQTDGNNNQLAYLHYRHGARIAHLNHYECGGVGNNYPMNYVSAKDADDFIKGINELGKKYSLPSEAQWEYASRGGSSNERSLFSGGDTIELCADFGKGHVNEDGNIAKLDGPTVVGSFLPNSLGIYDMSGNINEWCQDWYHSNWYSNESGKNGAVCDLKDVPSKEYQPFFLTRFSINGENYYLEDLFSNNFHVDAVDGKFPARVLRGGSWLNHATDCRVSRRLWNDPFYRSNAYGGFRLVFVP